jgi:hypothetical protein
MEDLLHSRSVGELVFAIPDILIGRNWFGAIYEQTTCKTTSRFGCTSAEHLKH